MERLMNCLRCKPPTPERDEFGMCVKCRAEVACIQFTGRRVSSKWTSTLLMLAIAEDGAGLERDWEELVK